MKRSDSLNALFVLISFILNTYYLYMFVEVLSIDSPYVQLERSHSNDDEDSYIPADEDKEAQKAIPKWVKSIDTDLDLDVLPDRAWFAGNPFYLGLDV